MGGCDSCSGSRGWFPTLPLRGNEVDEREPGLGQPVGDTASNATLGYGERNPKTSRKQPLKPCNEALFAACDLGTACGELCVDDTSGPQE